ncbi:glycosyltransferase [Candidatus Parcubacteria bacterium]|nr:glycosyltransferase [Patescibacteria group bacterium]MCG2693978.1 glycosyltransferase [Candidatus Parcubacteria bacterium]
MNKRIFLSGGGTLGSVMPLLSLWEDLQNDYDCYWIGSRKGVERDFIKKRGIKYFAIPSGKYSRYFRIKNLLTPFLAFLGLKFSFWYCIKIRPQLIIVSGSFVSVPLVWAGWILRIPVIVHQEDINIGLAGKLTFPFASFITTAFEVTAEAIKQKKVFWIGNPVRNIFYDADKREADKKWKSDSLPLILFLGGGIGSSSLNKTAVSFAKKNEGKCNIINITGKDKVEKAQSSNYKQMEQVDEDFAGLMLAADIVVSRAGLSTISELSALGKAVILIPLKGVGQIDNARFLKERKAAVLADEEDLEEKLEGLLKDKEKIMELEKNIKNIFPSHPKEKFLKFVRQCLN